MNVTRGRVSLRAPGIILGIGLGGFFDGIFLHQVFQFHHMFSSRIAVDTLNGLEMNTLGDGLFHTVTWLSVLLGLYLLYSRISMVISPGRVSRHVELMGTQGHAQNTDQRKQTTGPPHCVTQVRGNCGLHQNS